MIIEYDGIPIGVYVLNQIEHGKQGFIHAHIWRPEFRQSGISTFSLPKACKFFIDRFELSKIIFEIPITNLGANRAIQKYGITAIKEVVMDNPLVIENTKAFRYEFFPNQIEEFIKV